MRPAGVHLQRSCACMRACVCGSNCVCTFRTRMLVPLLLAHARARLSRASVLWRAAHQTASLQNSQRICTSRAPSVLRTSSRRCCRRCSYAHARPHPKHKHDVDDDGCCALRSCEHTACAHKSRGCYCHATHHQFSLLFTICEKDAHARACAALKYYICTTYIYMFTVCPHEVFVCVCVVLCAAASARAAQAHPLELRTNHTQIAGCAL